MDKKSAMMKPEKKRSKTKAKDDGTKKIEDVLASEESQEGKEEDETEAMT